MPQHLRLLAFWCHCCGQQVIEDHPIGWYGDECRSCCEKIERREQSTLVT